MNTVEKQIRNREQRTPVFYYDYEIRSISKDGEFALKGKTVKGQYIFQFDDPKETQAQEIAIVKDAAIRSLAFQKVPGVKHRDQTSKGYIINLKRGGNRVKSRLELGIDYEIAIGEKTKIKPVKEMTFDDIKDLGGE